MIQAAIFGLGRWGKNLVNSVQNQSSILRFKHAVVQTPEKYQEFANERTLLVTSDPKVVLSDPEIQMIVLATPHNLHVQQIRASAEAGKHVFCEKPLALNLSDALQAVSYCEKANVLLGVGHDKRFWPSMQAVKSIVQSGALGDLIHIEGIFTNENLKNFQTSWRDQAENVPGGSLTATGIHVLDAFTNLMGEVQSVEGIYRQINQGTQDTMAILYEFKTGATGLLSSPRPAPVFWRIHVFGSLGNVEARGPTEIHISMAGKPSETKIFENHNALQFQLEAFATAILENKPYLISPNEIVRTVRAFEATVKSIDTHQKITL
jgi:predicted dehydrogenase